MANLSATVRDLKVLVIDDNPVLLLYLYQLLKSHGISVAQSPDTDDLKEKIGAFLPDVILLDVILGNEIDGRQVCQMLSLDPDYYVTPVILISSYEIDGESVADSGAYGFIAKPFETHELLDLLKAAKESGTPKITAAEPVQD